MRILLVAACLLGACLGGPRSQGDDDTDSDAGPDPQVCDARFDAAALALDCSWGASNPHHNTMQTCMDACPDGEAWCDQDAMHTVGCPDACAALIESGCQDGW